MPEINSIDMNETPISAQQPTFPDRLLDWYDRHHRELAWRVSPGRRAAGTKPDPYRVWLSEIMLQQTTVKAVDAYFRKFVHQWPDVKALASARHDDVMKAWAGLGYYSRARNLKKCADLVAHEHDGQFPGTESALRDLPGIGDYTAAAIAAIAFDQPSVVVDGNVERVVTRHRAIATPMPAAKKDVKAVLAPLVPLKRPGDFAQAMMDLGATVCTPRRPACILCPVKEDCLSLIKELDPEQFPVKPPKKKRPVRVGAAFIAIRDDGAVLLEKRSDSGLLGGMTGLPTTAWTSQADGETGSQAAPFPASWSNSGEINHVFTHFELRLTIWRAENVNIEAATGQWWSLPQDLAEEALPTVMKKALEAAVPGSTKRNGR